MEPVKVGESERQYFNGAIRKVETESSVLISNSRYLNNAELRALIDKMPVAMTAANTSGCGRHLT